MKPTILRCAAAILLSGLALSIAHFEQPMQGQPAPAKVAQLRESVSATHCIGCHAGEKSPAYQEYKDEKRTEFIRLDEYHTWNELDLHRFAHKNITPSEKGGPNGGPNLAWKMQAALQQDKKRQVNGKAYQVERAAECLACHAVDLSWNALNSTALPIDKTLMDDEKVPRFSTRFGVSCEACHGFADKWLGEHIKISWRDKKPDDKLKEFGQVDLRSPRVRAERCASCHVGSKDEGKFVTHEMYAAGHPPLPVFEMANYGREQPAHYYPANANEAYKKMFDDEQKNKKPDIPASVRNRFHYRPDEIGEARDVAIGAIVGFRNNVKLLEHDAGNLKDGELLDFAHFDCAACHHDLKSPSDRQNRRGGIPGRPLMKVPTELLEVVVDHASNLEGAGRELNTESYHRFSKELEGLRTAFDARPFGNPVEIEKSAKSLNELSSKMLDDLENRAFRRDPKMGLQQAISARLLKLGEAKDGYLDHDSAQQLAWALRALIVKPSEKSVALAQTIGLSLREPVLKTPPQSVESRLPERLKKEKEYESRKFLKAINEWMNGD